MPKKNSLILILALFSSLGFAETLLDLPQENIAARHYELGVDPEGLILSETIEYEISAPAETINATCMSSSVAGNISKAMAVSGVAFGSMAVSCGGVPFKAGASMPFSNTYYRTPQAGGLETMYGLVGKTVNTQDAPNVFAVGLPGLTNKENFSVYNNDSITWENVEASVSTDCPACTVEIRPETTNIAGKTPQQYELSFSVPKNTPPGVYSASVTLVLPEETKQLYFNYSIPAILLFFQGDSALLDGQKNNYTLVYENLTSAFNVYPQGDRSQIVAKRSIYAVVFSECAVNTCYLYFAQAPATLNEFVKKTGQRYVADFTHLDNVKFKTQSLGKVFTVLGENDTLTVNPPWNAKIKSASPSGYLTDSNKVIWSGPATLTNSPVVEYELSNATTLEPEEEQKIDSLDEFLSLLPANKLSGLEKIVMAENLSWLKTNDPQLAEKQLAQTAVESIETNQLERLWKAGFEGLGEIVLSEFSNTTLAQSFFDIYTLGYQKILLEYPSKEKYPSYTTTVEYYAGESLLNTSSQTIYPGNEKMLLKLPSGTTQIKLSFSDFFSQKTVDTSTLLNPATINLEATGETVNIQGQVKSGGEPLKNAVVTIQGVSKNFVFPVDPKGKIDMLSPKGTTGVLKILAPGHQPFSTSIALNQDVAMGTVPMYESAEDEMVYPQKKECVLYSQEYVCRKNNLIYEIPQSLSENLVEIGETHYARSAHGLYDAKNAYDAIKPSVVSLKRVAAELDETKTTVVYREDISGTTVTHEYAYNEDINKSSEKINELFLCVSQAICQERTLDSLTYFKNQTIFYMPLTPKTHTKISFSKNYGEIETHAETLFKDTLRATGTPTQQHLPRVEEQELSFETKRIKGFGIRADGSTYVYTQSILAANSTQKVKTEFDLNCEEEKNRASFPKMVEKEKNVYELETGERVCEVSVFFENMTTFEGDVLVLSSAYQLTAETVKSLNRFEINLEEGVEIVNITPGGYEQENNEFVWQRDIVDAINNFVVKYKINIPKPVEETVIIDLDETGSAMVTVERVFATKSHSMNNIITLKAQKQLEDLKKRENELEETYNFGIANMGANQNQTSRGYVTVFQIILRDYALLDKEGFTISLAFLEIFELNNFTLSINLPQKSTLKLSSLQKYRAEGNAYWWNGVSLNDTQKAIVSYEVEGISAPIQEQLLPGLSLEGLPIEPQAIILLVIIVAIIAIAYQKRDQIRRIFESRKRGKGTRLKKLEKLTDEYEEVKMEGPTLESIEKESSSQDVLSMLKEDLDTGEDEL